MKRGVLKKITYIGLSMGVASLLIFTALPYYLQTSIAFPGWNIFWSYADVQRKMMWLFPGLALLSALTTLKKRNTWIDVFLNVSLPMTVLLGIRCFQYHPLLVLTILVTVIVSVAFLAVDICCEDRYARTSEWTKLRLCYYRGRKRGILLLLILLTPLTVWTARQELHEKDFYLRMYSLYANTDNTVSRAANEWDVADEETWNTLSVTSRLEEFTKMITYFLQDQGGESVKVYACKELVDGTLAWYSDSSESISVNVIYLDSCSYREAVHIAAHECRHRVQHQGIRALETLESAGINCQKLEYFSDLYALKAASDQYGMDSLDYEAYTHNLLEQDSEAYALEQERRLEEAGCLTQQPDTAARCSSTAQPPDAAG